MNIHANEYCSYRAYAVAAQCSVRQRELVTDFVVKHSYSKARAIIRGWKEWLWHKVGGKIVYCYHMAPRVDKGLYLVGILA